MLALKTEDKKLNLLVKWYHPIIRRFFHKFSYKFDILNKSVITL